jgi:hypothetical protein
MLRTRKKERESSGGVGFPDFITLSCEDSTCVKGNLFRSIGIDDSLSSRQIGIAFSSKLVLIGESIQNDEMFIRTKLISFCGYDPIVVFVNFFEFETIEVIALSELSRTINDIWRPGAEDIDIFDCTYSWVFQINHEEILLALRVGDEKA